MDDFKKAGQFAGSVGGGGGGGGAAPDFDAPKFSSNFATERPIVFGSGGAAHDNNHYHNNNNNSVGPAAAAKRGRDRARSASPIFRPPIPPSHFAGQQQDTAGKVFGKSPDQQREEEAAKARRLLRFGTEFGTPKAPAKPVSSNEDEEASMSYVPSAGVTLEPGSKTRQAITGRSEATIVEAVMVDMDAPDNLTSEPILGICPDMCPETELSERERKGDLDRFERVGGSRNQTSRDLAVKKYTRTAEKHALLIRPLPVLKKTMGHLLSLLDRDYEDDLLAVHSFLWDRMRAVRMDLRMQHIFTEDAIVMHEQMIRFHILAMHELCEFSEGEGISEVFNAHLNIEQMNKASVDLFQMYNDHLKGGISVPSEAEFRGYYALLKLDKHPGYNVEPAELSLDLANMTPEIRNSREVRFARDVARACRASNFVAFFRLAREATYLQACLMHAHFSKLRTQALASLHSGLQKNQGIPLSTVVDWLGMEGEDIDALIKYHGFSLKYYEEAYMVKEGSFLNRNEDFPIYRSQLVEAKRSARTVMDVKADKHLDTMPETPFASKRISTMERKVTVRRDSMERKGPPSSDGSPALASLETLVQTKEEEMPDYIEETIEGVVEEIEEVTVAPVAEVVKPRAEEEGKQGKKRRMDEPQFDAEEHERRRLRHQADAVSRRAASQAAAAEMKRKEEERIRAGHDAEAYVGKQGSWFRKWRRRAAAKALERHRKQLVTAAALDTLSLGSPLWKMRVGGASLSFAHRSEFTKSLLEEQGLKLQQVWEPLDMPNLVGPILRGLNPAAHSLAYRLVLSMPGSPSGQWVRTKVGSRRKSGTGQDLTNEAHSNISIAEESRVLNGNQPGSMVEFQYSVRDLGAAYTGLYAGTLDGVGGLLFLTNEEDDVAKEGARLHSLVQTLKEGASVPLLVLSTRSKFVHASDFDDQSSQQELSRELKLGELSTSRVSNYRVVSVVESSMSGPGTNVYFSEEALREGIVWLAKLFPIQPQLRSLRVSDLLKEHLDTGLKRLLKIPLSEVNPERCIELFNRGIRDTAGEIASNASSLLIGSSPSSCIDQKRFTGGIHQAQGWRSKETLEGLSNNLNSCALPPFPPFEHIRNLGNINLQKLGIEQLLLQFLNQVEGNCSENLAVKWEVTRLVQRGCTVEWSESGMKLVPKWAKIFQAIFAARLLLLSIKPWPLVSITRINKNPSPMDADENETNATKIRAGPDFSGDVQLLLDDMIGTEFERPVSTQSESAVLSEEKVTEEASPPPSRSYVSHGTQSRRQSMGDGNLMTLPKTISTLEKYMGYRLPQDSPFEWLVERDEESQAKRLRMAFTESERSLDKMLAEVRRQGHRKGDNLRAQKGNGLDASPDLSPVKVANPELEHELNIRSSDERADFKRVEGEPGSFQEVKVASQNCLLPLSPFEELLDRMVSSSRKGINGSEQYPMGMVTSRRQSHPGIEDYRARYQDLQSSTWTA